MLTPNTSFSRRALLKAGLLLPWVWAPLRARPSLVSPPWALAGDVTGGQATLIAGDLGEGRLKVNWSVLGDHSLAGTVRGSEAWSETGYTARAELSDLPANETILCRAQIGRRSVECEFRTPPVQRDHAVRFLWGGDVAGQGYGIDPVRGGMATFASMLTRNPDFFIHSGDSIYADGPIPAEIRLDDGTVWNNIVTPEKSRVAKTLADFQGNHRYNFLDKHYRRFFSKVPVIAQWDDHEVIDNWDPHTNGELATLGRQAFLDYWPLRPGSDRLYRSLSYGPNLDIFVLDLRSHRAPNSDNRQTESSEATPLLGATQLAWLKRELKASRATWKVIAGEMPLSTHSPHWGLDNWTNGEGPPLGRELELADLLSFMKEAGVVNTIWLSADVHYAAAIEFQPQRATFGEFEPFWEFIAGPLHAGTFPPAGPLDPTFGPKMEFCAVPKDLAPNRPPSDNHQFFGQVDVKGSKLRVSLHQRQGRELFHVDLKAR